MRRVLFGVSILIAMIIPGTVSAQVADNPFFSSGSGDEVQETVEKKERHHLFGGIKSKLVEIQSGLNEIISDSKGEYRETGKVGKLFFILLIAFVYGVIHALGPGHGKLFTLSYFMTEQAKPVKGLSLGVMIAFMHALSAILLIVAFKFIFNIVYSQESPHYFKILRMISFSIIVALALFLLIKTIREKRRSNEEAVPRIVDKTAVAMALSIGMIPCEGAILLLFLFLNVGMFGFGIISVLFMAMGMALSISAVGLITLGIKSGAIRIVNRNQKISRFFENSIEYAGIGLMLVIGSLFLVLTII